MTQQEVWKRVKGYESLYRVSNHGRVYGIKRKNYLRSAPNRQGYLMVALCKNGKLKTVKVHRLVALAFIANKTSRPYVNHKDSNVANNNVSNLEWSSPSENRYHAAYKGRLPHKLSHNDVRSIRSERLKGDKQSTLAVKYGVTQSLISRIINNKRVNYV